MPYSSKCSICNHKHVEVINDLLRRRALGETGITFNYIIDTVNRLGGPAFQECTLSRHLNNHFDVAAEGRRRAQEEYDRAADEVKDKTISDLQVLDEIRDIGFQLIKDGELRPDVKDLIAAIKVKHGTVMKEENPLGAILDALAGVALDD